MLFSALLPISTACLSVVRHIEELTSLVKFFHNNWLVPGMISTATNLMAQVHSPSWWGIWRMLSYDYKCKFLLSEVEYLGHKIIITTRLQPTRIYIFSHSYICILQIPHHLGEIVKMLLLTVPRCHLERQRWVAFLVVSSLKNRWSQGGSRLKRKRPSTVLIFTMTFQASSRGIWR